VDGRIEVRAGVFAGGDVVPIPGRAALVVLADLGQRERPGLPELLGQGEDRRLGRQQGGEVDDLDAAGGQRGGEVLQQGHAATLERPGLVLNTGSSQGGPPTLPGWW